VRGIPEREQAALAFFRAKNEEMRFCTSNEGKIRHCLPVTPSVNLLKSVNY
jgi:hypothetical protein